MKMPGNNTFTMCPAALMNIVQEALNARTYDSKDFPIRVTSVKAQAENSGSTVFHFCITTDAEKAL